ncbi:MAG TPA: glycerol-3-phosphate 1-O-acyltransferase PlsY [Steroidobacteraceae bacterium]|nr:glycerol-3-phosphate 1-O-acyltransferase PlsY [Steroidobacteraceae bacterium]
MSELLIKGIVSYLLGSIAGGLVVGRLRGGVDIRLLGSGNAGGTNALRTQGKRFALWVLLIDIGKGWAAVRVVAPWGRPPGLSELLQWLPGVCALAVILGHVYPVWYGFRGGKGVATLLGTLLGLAPWLLLPVLLVWLAAVALTGFVGLASMLAAVAVPVGLSLSNGGPRVPLVWFGAAAACLIVFTHRANIARMRAGTEPRARRLWLLGRRART